MDPATSNKPWRCSFWFLILTQFQGAFNDNAYKFLVILWIASLGLREDARDRLALAEGDLPSPRLFGRYCHHVPDRVPQFQPGQPRIQWLV